MSVIEKSIGATLSTLSQLADGAPRESPDAGFALFVERRDGGLAQATPPALTAFTDAPALATAGYYLDAGLMSGAKGAWIEGLRKLQRKDPFPADREAFFFRPVELLGIVLGITAVLKPADPEYVWIVEKFAAKPAQELLSGPPTWASLIYRIAAYAVGAKAPALQALEWAELDDPARCLLSWSKARYPELPGMKAVNAEPNALLERALSESWAHFSAPQAAIARAALRLYVKRGIEADYRPTDTVLNILRGVEPGLRRWRYDDAAAQNPVRWQISGEKHVQDLLWLVLRPCFPDLVDEEYLPKFGFKQSKPDFAIPSLELLIEVKFVSKPAQYKERFEEIGKDVIEYFHASDKFKRLIVVLYDDVPCPENHEQFVTELKKIDKVEGVVIIQRPGKLAVAAVQ